MNFYIPEKVNCIIEELMKQGFEAYAVGGCVRDMILGRVPEDWDITTSATPQEVKRIFRRTVDTGIAHGTVTVLIDKEHFEVTTYRLDGEYEDNRHPKEVSFTSSLTEDLKRRDFTI
jgi:tRNA nucleotidyltransferase (CCA-adding enzyme)